MYRKLVGVINLILRAFLQFYTFKFEDGLVKDSMVLMGQILSSFFADLSVEEAQKMVATLLTNR
jgi:hypothetical protein